MPTWTPRSASTGSRRTRSPLPSPPGSCQRAACASTCGPLGRTRCSCARDCSSTPGRTCTTWGGRAGSPSWPTAIRRHGTRRRCGGPAPRPASTRPIRVPRGERAKTVGALVRLWDALGAAGIGRDGGVIAVGGGAVGDDAGFAAATYLRGVRVAHVPTTLLAMVDSSIGGKTGIDLGRGKNLAGAFHQPDAVLADPSVLASLPRRERASGFAEIAKSAFIADRDAVAQVERSAAAVVDGDLGPTLGAIALAVTVKGGIVAADEREAGLRELLNFGQPR